MGSFTPKQLREWGTTVLGLLIVAGDFVLYFTGAWSGRDNAMSQEDWLHASALLAAGLAMLGYRDSWISKLIGAIRGK